MAGSFPVAAKLASSSTHMLQALRDYGTEGLLVGVLVAGTALQLSGLGSVDESHTIVELSPRVDAHDSHSPSAGQANVDAAVSTVRTLERLVIQVARGAKQRWRVADGSRQRPFETQVVDDNRLVITCRGSVHAQDNCAWLAREATARVAALRIIQAATPVRTALPEWLAGLFGLAGAVAWVVSRALWRRRRPGNRDSQPEAPEQLVGRPSNPQQVNNITGVTASTRVIIPSAPAATWHRAIPVQHSAVDRPALDDTVRAVGFQQIVETTAEPSPASGESGAEPARTPNAGQPSSRSAPEDLVALYAAAHGWSPHPAMSGSTAFLQLDMLSRQLDGMAATGCLVIRMASAPESATMKTEVAVQLAWMLAGTRRLRVLLLESDFDYPALHRVLKLEVPPFKGFSQQLYARIRTGIRAPWAVAQCAPSLHVLPEGHLRTPGLLATVQFSSALAELRRCHDIIIADGPEVGSGVDTRALDGVVDGVVFVALGGDAQASALRIAAEVFADQPNLWVIRADASAES
jgi:Mrp family chromosome partitioning ATPase